MMNKKAPFFYRMARTFLGPIFRWYYHPTIIGDENIPKEGAILIVGNHKHLYDQCLTIMATKRGIHYMAKREYFDNKKIAWFFKLSGCISVDRSKKDASATNLALEVLKDGGAIGLFPEGTRNGLKDTKIEELYQSYCKDICDYSDFQKMLKDQKPKASRVYLLENLLKENRISLDSFQKAIYHVEESLQALLKEKVITKKEYQDSCLLPFKFGAVSMASKVDAYLVPFGISGDYKFHSKNLVIRYGKPFKVGNMSYEKANQKLFKEVKKLMDEEK